MTPTPKPLSKNESVLFLVLIFFFFGIFLLNLVSFIQEITLSTSGTLVTAEITDWAVYTVQNRHGGRTDYEVQYKFDVDGQSYTYSDSTGRKELWATLPKADWEASKSIGTLPVLYNAKNPWTNRPQYPDDWPYGGPIAGMSITGGITALLCWVWKVSKPKNHLNP